METFDFPYHTVRDKFPDNASTIQFGKGYRFTAKPRSPDQITFYLKFPTMIYLQNMDGTLDLVSNARMNMNLLIEFYKRHGCWKRFLYPHVRMGLVTVRFNKPLETPDVRSDSKGLTETFNMEMILDP